MIFFWGVYPYISKILKHMDKPQMVKKSLNFLEV